MVISRRIRSLAAVAALVSLSMLPSAADAQGTCQLAAAFVYA